MSSFAKSNICSPRPFVREHHAHAVPGNHDGRERQEEAVSEAEELRLVGCQQASRWPPARSARDSETAAFGHLLSSAYGCRQVRQGIAGASDKCLVRRSAVSPGHELHVHRGRFAVAGALALDKELLDDAGQQLGTSLTLSCTDENGTADLVEDGCGALLIRRVDDVRLERVDGRELAACDR